MQDSQLLELIRSGQKNALELLYTKYFKSIYRFFYYQSNFNTELSQDLTHDTFLEIAKSLKNFKGKGSLKNWIYTIAKRQFAHHLKTKYQIHETSLFENISNNSNWIDPQEQDKKINKLEKVLTQLKPQEQQIVRLRYLKNLTVKETAKKLKLSESNIKTSCHRIIKKLQNQNT